MDKRSLRVGCHGKAIATLMLLCSCAPVPPCVAVSPAGSDHAWRSVVPVTDEAGDVRASATVAHCADGDAPDLLWTAEHVTRGDRKIYVQGRRALFVRRADRADLSLILVRVDGCYAARLPATDPRPGDRVAVVGSAAGVPGSVTVGHVVHSTLVDSPAGLQWRALRISAPIISGQSGGGVFVDGGWLVGIASHYRGPFGLSFPAAGYAVHASVLREMWAAFERERTNDSTDH